MLLASEMEGKNALNDYCICVHVHAPLSEKESNLKDLLKLLGC